jgi:hypothetical protein
MYNFFYFVFLPYKRREFGFSFANSVDLSSKLGGRSVMASSLEQKSECSLSTSMTVKKKILKITKTFSV